MSKQTIDRLVVYKELKENFGVPYTKQHLLRLEKAKKFPRRAHLNNGRAIWKTSEVADWCDRQMKKRDDKSA